ncbi:MAG: ABC transporter substrate-binding protein [Marinobacter sp.]|nr:ABC transporter substrate-binding protein [Marinobacter sp.]
MRTGLITLVTLIALALPPASAAPREITLAVAGPMSGGAAAFGRMQVAGAMLAVDAINQAGGINGTPLAIKVLDDQCNPQRALQVARDVIAQGIRFVIGHLCSSASQPASDLYLQADVLMITPGSTNPDLTRRGNPLVFRTIGLDTLQGPVAARHIASLQAARVALLHDGQQYGEGLTQLVRQTLENEGISITLVERITPGDQNFRRLIQRLKQSNADVIYYGGYTTELGHLLRQARQAGLQTQFMAAEAASNDELHRLAGQALSGLLITMPPAFHNREGNEQLTAAIRAQGHDPGAPFILTSHAAVTALAEALRQNGDAPTAAIADALRAGRFDTAIGELRFDPQGDLETFQFQVFRLDAQGQRHPVAAPLLAE